MLCYLRIQNLALIADAELEFAPGLNALTGETGAGKSFILKALDFLTGGRMEAASVRPGAERAVVEAIFECDGREMAVRRELSAETGRSRLFCDDSLASLERMAELRPRLFLLTSQHAQARLLSAAHQAELLDAFTPAPELFARRAELLGSLRETARELARCREKALRLADKREFLEFQAREIAKVAPKAGEEDELMARREALKGAAEAGEACGRALGLLHGQGEGLLEGADMLARELKRLAQADEGFAADAEAVEDFRHRLRDLATRLRAGPAQADEAEVEAVEKRLWELAQLKRRLKRELDDIVALSREIEENLSFLDACGLDEARLSREEARLAAELSQVLGRLDEARQRGADELCARLEESLRELGFAEQVRVLAEFSPQEVHPGVSELRGRILWAPNPGQPPQSLERIASGGELSRFLLALAGLSADSDSPCLIFDEVDAGVGGMTLHKVAERLERLAASRQVLVISHWPQLAARARRHFQVSKEIVEGLTTTRCRALAAAEVEAELARMAGGGDQGLRLARDLLARSAPVLAGG